ncbi:hypothetical protein BBJ28_00001293 [Nothophytophthora sp. Chile5]|nr:hypothetical protein BBJ28_00001293 [Nothophytophthora sp. Chile5]
MEDTTVGWHRKWIALAVILGWAFLYRSRLIGLVLSKAISYQLAKSRGAPIDVRVKSVSLHPLRFLNVELSSTGATSWRIGFTSVAIRTHVREFFESFGLVKICILEVDEVHGDVARIDEAQLRALFFPERTTPLSAVKPPMQPKTNPISFMRFVDLKVGAIRLGVNCLGVTAELRCNDLYTGITDIFVKQNMLHLKVQTKSVVMRSYTQVIRSSDGLNDSLGGGQEDFSDDGIHIDVPKLSAVLNLDLTNQGFRGCKLLGCKDQTAAFQVSTAFLETLLESKNVLLQTELGGLSSIDQDGVQRNGELPGFPMPSASGVLDASPKVLLGLEIVDFHFRLIVVNDVEEIGSVPLQFCAEVHKFIITRQRAISDGSPSNSELLEHGSDNNRIDDDMKVHVEAVVENMHVKTLGDSSTKMLAVSCFEMHAIQSDGDHGIARCMLRNIDCSMNRHSERICRSLFAVQERVQKSQVEARAMVHAPLGSRSGGPEGGKNALKQSSHISWDLVIEISSWTLVMGVNSTPDFEARGLATSIQTSLSPIRNDSGLPCTKRFITVRQVDVNVAPSEMQAHTATFWGATMTMTSTLDPAQLTKVNQESLRCDYVSINGLLRESRAVTDRRPAICLCDVTLEREESVAKETTEVAMKISIIDTRVEWDYRQHNDFLVEWTAIKSIADQLEQMLSSSKISRVSEDENGSNGQTVVKILGVNVWSKKTVVNVSDIPNVCSSATFSLTDARVKHKATHLSISTAFNCTSANLLWGDVGSVIDVTGASFQKRSSLGRQRYLTKVPVQIDIGASTLHIRLHPENRVLLLFQRLDELVSAPPAKTDTAKVGSAQRTAFVCTTLTVELDDGSGNENVASLILSDFSIKLTRCSTHEITDALVRLADSMGRTNLVDRAFSDILERVVTMEGTASASAVTIAKQAKRVAAIQDLELRFSITEVEWVTTFLGHPWQSPEMPRTTGFDLSLLTQHIHLVPERKSIDSLLRLEPFVQEAFDTKQRSESEGATTETQPSSFLLRYVGNFDLACLESELICPYGGNASADTQASVGQKQVRIVVGEAAFSLRQFQTLGFRCTPLRAMLENVDSADNKTEDALQLLFLPAIGINSVIHWKDKTSIGVLEYSLSLDISMRSSLASDNSGEVPVNEEAIVALKWDYVYPWLVYMTTEDDDDPPVNHSTARSLSGSCIQAETTDDPARTQCVGVQWDISIGLIQIAWWDAMTPQETGMLVVANDFLSHGVARTAKSLASEQIEEEKEWQLWEATIYLDLLRIYLLHEACIDDVFGTSEVTHSNVLPFEFEKTANFFLEAVGTSYRSTYSLDDTENWDDLDEEINALFAPASATVFERIHENFISIDYEFSLVGPTKVCKLGLTGQLTSLQIPQSPKPAPAANAALKPSLSPRSVKNWTQGVRHKLTRLNRRSVSMDNLLLNDGSCPIQVDSMKLLWTIQTRDSVFHMVSVTLDSLRLLLSEQQGISDDDKSEGEGEISTTPISPSRREKRSSFRSPSLASNQSRNKINRRGTEVSRGNTNRRGSTRDTLLDLLQQGKLGIAQTTDRESTPPNLDGGAKCTSGGLGEDTCEDESSKAIAVKTYTLDVHDAQINVREEGTRSNVLVASKHIHFEIGLDACEISNIAHLKFDSVTSHVAPIDVDISAGVLWYSQTPESISSAESSRGTLPSVPRSTLLKKIVEECSLTATYVHTLATGSTSTQVDLSFLQLATDRHQFYQLLNVIRHVLLAPPTAVKRSRRAAYTPRANPTEAAPQQDGGEIMMFVPPSPTANVPVQSTKKLHVLLEEELRNREVRTRGTSSRANMATTALKAISFKVVGLQLRLRLSPEITGTDHEFVEIRVQGVTGCHTYFSNYETKLTLNLQWLEVNNLHPGPSSVAFEDAMAVLKAKLLVDNRYQSSSKIHLGNQKGMLMFRAESGPIVRVLGQKLRVLDVLEVSIFPEISNMIVIQLAADFYDLVYKFFFEQIAPGESHDVSSQQILFGRKASTTMGSTSGAGGNATSGPKSPGSPFTKARTPPTASTQPLQSSLRPLHLLKVNSAGSSNSMLAEPSGAEAANGPNSPRTAINSDKNYLAEDGDTATDDCELFYFKYVRIGNVRLRINCNGFFVNLSNFDLDLPPYVCQSKLCTSKKLLQKFESHLKWFVTKESASSGLSQFKNKLLKWTPSSSSASDRKDKSKRQEEDTATANAQVLFGPYTGAPT